MVLPRKTENMIMTVLLGGEVDEVASEVDLAVDYLQDQGVSDPAMEVLGDVEEDSEAPGSMAGAALTEEAVFELIPK